jgi:hypothetical protein
VTAKAASPRTLLRLGLPEPAAVETDATGEPVRIDGRSVEAVRGRWIVEEGWWTDQPIRRRYVEAVLANGRLVTVYQDLVEGGWRLQPHG